VVAKFRERNLSIYFIAINLILKSIYSSINCQKSVCSPLSQTRLPNSHYTPANPNRKVYKLGIIYLIVIINKREPKLPLSYTRSKIQDNMKEEKKYINICKNQKIKDITDKILELFKTGNIPESIALLTNPKINVPLNNWSLRNKLIALAYGTQDARGFNVWKTSNRHVNKGSKAFNILAPLIIKDDDEISEKNKLIGFRPVPVFKVEDTDGESLDYEKIEVPNFRFIEVAKKWGLEVKGIGSNSGYYGAYSPGEKKIFMASPEEEVFFHELAHAAHDKIGLLKRRNIKQREIIAEFSGAVLVCLENKKTNRIGNAYAYLKSYCGEKDINKEVLNLISDIDKVLNTILETEKLIKDEVLICKTN